jgi:fermentation-respiration switch protein FrsA (DUF1100 family)
VRALASLLVLAAVAYAIVVAIVYALQARLIYLPTAVLEGSPRDIGLAYDELHFTASDGVRLHGWWIPAQRARGALLFMHGNAGNISHRLESIRLFHGLGLDVLIFDYRGYGRSEGYPSEQGTYRDALAAWDTLLARGAAAGRTVLFGRSLGGAIAAQLATEVEPAALIVESSFTSATNLAAELYPWLPARSLLRHRYDTLDRLRDVDCPLLIVHSEEDELIPYAHSVALFAQAREPKQFLKIAGTHAAGFSTTGESYRKGLDDFLSTVLPPRA